jgi:hypothetical protein
MVERQLYNSLQFLEKECLHQVLVSNSSSEVTQKGVVYRGRKGLTKRETRNPFSPLLLKLDFKARSRHCPSYSLQRGGK